MTEQKPVLLTEAEWRELWFLTGREEIIEKLRERGLIAEEPVDPCKEWQEACDLAYPPTPFTLEYRKAAAGLESEHALNWADKPHRLVNELCAVIERDAALNAKENDNG